MNQQKLEKLIENGETQEVEFTSKADEDIGKTICSFANTNEGVILTGVSDKGEVSGAKEKDEQKIANIAHTCKPSIYPKIEKVKVEGKAVFVVGVKKSDQIHSFKNVAYKRVGTHDKPLSPEEVIEFAKSVGKIRWDEQVCEEASLDDIDEDGVKKFLRTAEKRRGLEIQFETIEEALKKLKLMKNGKLTNTCVLMFARNPLEFFLQDEVKCARFKGVTTKEFIDMNEFSGPAYEQVDDAKKFVLKNIKKAAWIEPGKVERQEKWEYPVDSIREAITNAVVHRDYQSASKVQVRVFDDRIEVWNPGTLPEGWTVETLKQEHESRPFNPLLARMFFLIKYIEEWGRGTTDMVRDCLDYGLPEPEFKDTGTSIVIIFRKSKLTEEYLEKMKLNNRQKEIIDYLRGHETVTSSEYAKMLDITPRTARNDLKNLTKKSIISARGKGKKGRFYVLTEI